MKNVVTFFVYINTGDNTNINYESLTRAYIVYLIYSKDLHNLVFIYLYSDTIMILSDIVKISELIYWGRNMKNLSKDVHFS